MLLLILFAGCLASCAAQTTTTSPSKVEESPPAFTEFLPSESTDNALVFLETTIKSYIKLNETTVVPVLDQVTGLIHEFIPNLSFIITVKDISKVKLQTATNERYEMNEMNVRDGL